MSIRWRKISRHAISRRLHRIRISILYWMTVFVCFVLRPVIRIRLATLDTLRVGHFISEADLALTLLKSTPAVGAGRALALFLIPDQTCNEQLRTMYMRALDALEGVAVLDERASRVVRILLPAVRQLGQRAVAGGRSARYYCGSPISGGLDFWGIVNSGRPHVAFTDQEVHEAKQALTALGISLDVPYVCLHVRDSHYLSQALPGMDWSYHDYRNPPPESYVEAVAALHDLGYVVIRMGKFAAEAPCLEVSGVVDYATCDLRSDLLDVFLYANCAFAISGGGSGIDQLGTAFGKPMVLTNWIPFTEPLYAVRPLLTLPALLAWKEGRVVLPLSEMLRSRRVKASHYDESGIEIVYNTPLEISSAVMEMHARLSGQATYSEEQLERQSSFWTWADTCGVGDMTPPGAPDVLCERGDIASYFLEHHSGILMS